MSAPEHPDIEETPAGRQTLIAGVAALTLRERLQWKANAPLEPRAAQRRCDHGLFDLNARAQTDLIDELRRFDRNARLQSEAEAPPQPQPEEKRP